MELHDDEDVDIFKENPNLGKSIFKVDRELNIRWPRLLIYNINREFKIKDLVSAIKTKK